MGKILIKNKRRHISTRASNGGSVKRRTTDGVDAGEPTSPVNDCPLIDGEACHALSNGGERLAERMVKDSEIRKSIDRGDGESEDEEEEEPVTDLKKHNSDEGTAYSEVNATEEMSTLVNYVEPVKFKSFEAAAKRNKFYEMSSLVETKGMDTLKSSPIEFVEYNKKQLSRIYPKGTRVDSSNYMPQLFWNMGCQMVALNFQTLDLPMQLNMGVFEYNGHCGYLQKPEFMRRTDKHFDPFTENIVDGIVANTVKIRIISGQFLSDKKVGVYVEVDMFGLPADTKRKYRTRTSNNNSLDPVWDDETFVFNKVVLPTLASLRVAVLEENGKFLGHRILPVLALRPGYHYINLKNELNQPLTLPSLLVYTEAQDYIPNEHQEYAEALTNPIKHVSLLDQRERQLAALMEEYESYQVKQEEVDKCDPTMSSVDFSCPLPSPPLPTAVSDVINPAGPGQKEDLINTVLTEVLPQSVDELKQHKMYVKLLKKQCKELKELRKKHLKKVWALSKEQKSRSNQITMDIQRRRSQVEKRLNVKMKKNEPDEPVRSELTELEVELQQQTVQLREWQMQELLTLRQAQHQLERERKQSHLKEAYQKLREIGKDCQSGQLKKLKEICDKEKKELQRILDRKRQNSIIEVKKGDREKAESDLNEINRKHITESVSLLRSLDKAQVKRYDRLRTRQCEVLQHVEEELPVQLTRLDRDCEAELRSLPEEICRYLQGELESKGLRNDALFSRMSNHRSPSSDPSSNCSTPSFSSPNHSWSRSLDNSTTSLGDSSSSSTPVTSEAELSAV